MRPALGPYKEVVRGWLVADLEVSREQRHRARRVWQRVVDECAADVAALTVRSFVAEVRAELVGAAKAVTAATRGCALRQDPSRCSSLRVPIPRQYRPNVEITDLWSSRLRPPSNPLPAGRTDHPSGRCPRRTRVNRDLKQWVRGL